MQVVKLGRSENGEYGYFAHSSIGEVLVEVLTHKEYSRSNKWHIINCYSMGLEFDWRV